MSVLTVESLRVKLATPAGDVTIVDGVDYDVQPGEVFGVAGESGSGKTISMLALLGLLPERSSVELQYTDTDGTPGRRYYYVRVMQANGEMAWGSPVWVTFGDARR